MSSVTQLHWLLPQHVPWERYSWRSLVEELLLFGLMWMSEKWPWPEMALKKMTQVYSIALLISALEEDSSDPYATANVRRRKGRLGQWCLCLQNSRRERRSSSPSCPSPSLSILRWTKHSWLWRHKSPVFSSQTSRCSTPSRREHSASS